MMNHYSVGLSITLLLSISSAFAMQLEDAKKARLVTSDKVIESAKRTAKDNNKSAVVFSSDALTKIADTATLVAAPTPTVYELQWTKEDGKWISTETDVLSTPLSTRPAVSLDSTLSLQAARNLQLAKEISIQTDKKQTAEQKEALKKQLAIIEAKEQTIQLEAAKNAQDTKLTTEEFARRQSTLLAKVEGLRRTIKQNTAEINKLAQANTANATEISTTEKRLTDLQLQAPKKSGWLW